MTEQIYYVDSLIWERSLRRFEYSSMPGAPGEYNPDFTTDTIGYGGGGALVKTCIGIFAFPLWMETSIAPVQIVTGPVHSRGIAHRFRECKLILKKHNGGRGHKLTKVPCLATKDKHGIFTTISTDVSDVKIWNKPGKWTYRWSCPLPEHYTTFEDDGSDEMFIFTMKKDDMIPFGWNIYDTWLTCTYGMSARLWKKYV